MPRVAALYLLMAVLTGAAAHAAPTTADTASDAQPAERDERRLPDRLRSTGSASGSGTIDLLIDMQQRSPGLQFNERQRPAGSGEIKPRPAAAAVATAPAAVLPATPPRRPELPPTPPSGLFGSGATPMVQSARTANVDARGPSGADLAAARRPAPSSQGEPLPRWLLLPREVIVYVRDNRWLVLGSVGGGLLLIWGVSSLFARAAANAGRVPGPQGDRAFSADRWGSGRHEVRPGRRRSHRRPG